MENIIYKIMRFILDMQQKKHNKKMQNLNAIYKTGTTKRAFHGSTELILNTETERKKIELNKQVKAIAKETKNNPEELLNYIKNEGTDVFRINNADFILKLIGEEEGFIAPTRGFKALYINLVVNYLAYNKFVISLKSNELFILRPLQIDIYYMLHQFHKWYSYKMGLPGYDFKDQENFKKNFKHMNDEDISHLSVNDILALKEAIARDTEAIDFVINLAKEQDSSKKLVKKLKDGKSIKL